MESARRYRARNRAVDRDGLLVLGGGTMGAGIALAGALGAFATTVIEPNADVVRRSRERLTRAAQRAGDPSATDRIRFAGSLGEIVATARFAFVIEAISERFDAKRALFAVVEPMLARDAILATNTSSLSVTELSAALTEPERFVGLHFFNPPVAMALVEVIVTERTNSTSLERALAFVAAIGKTAVVVRDTPGFIVNRVARPYYLHALHVLEHGRATAETIDRLATGIGMPMGPLALADMIGHDVNEATTTSIYERTGLERLRPSELQRSLVAAGRLGRKSGAGIYRYDTDGHRLEPDAPAAIPFAETESGALPVPAGAVAIAGHGSVSRDAFRTLQRASVPASFLSDNDAVGTLRADVAVAFEASATTGPQREALLSRLDAALPPGALFLVDAFLTAPEIVQRIRKTRDVVGYGLVGPLDMQSTVELARDGQTTGDALLRAAGFFGMLGKSTAVVNESAGLVLGRTIASILNEAIALRDEGIASAHDIDAALRLGAGYPIGPLAWAERIGYGRLRNILAELARREGPAYGPTPSLANG